jgi:cytochrome c556
MHYLSHVAGVVALSLLASCSHRTASTAPPAGTGTSAPVQAQLTPQNLEELMKKIGPTYKSLVAHLQANDTAESAKEAQQLAEWFGGVEKFWAQHNRDDAVKLADHARTYASEAAGAAATGNGEKATVAANNMAAACKQCHGTFRESDGADGYRIKPGVITP